MRYFDTAAAFRGFAMMVALGVGEGMRAGGPDSFGDMLLAGLIAGLPVAVLVGLLALPVDRLKERWRDRRSAGRSGLRAL
jgi:hypothetical protein